MLARSGKLVCWSEVNELWTFTYFRPIVSHIIAGYFLPKLKVWLFKVRLVTLLICWNKPCRKPFIDWRLFVDHQISLFFTLNLSNHCDKCKHLLCTFQLVTNKIRPGKFSVAFELRGILTYYIWSASSKSPFWPFWFMLSYFWFSTLVTFEVWLKLTILASWPHP